MIESSTTEAELVRRIQAGDREALKEIFYLYKNRVYHLCLKYTANAADASDLTQEVFLKVAEKIRDLRDENRFSSWIFRLAANLACTHLRGRGRLVFEDEDQPLEALTAVQTSESPQPLRILEVERDLQLAHEAIGSLPDGYREVFVSYFLGYSHKQIAEELGIREDSSRSQLHKARKRFWEKMEELRNPARTEGRA